MPRALLAALAGSALLAAGTPALAGGDRGYRGGDWRWQGQGGEDWGQRDDSRAQQQAYRQGYRDGLRAAGRGPVGDAGWSRRGGWQAPTHARPVVVRQPGWGQPGWGQPGWGQAGWGQPGWAYPASSAGWVRGRDYWFDNGRYRCRRPDGSAGVVVGAVAGGTLGNILAGQGDKTLGTIIGGTLGAIVGEEIARGNARCR